MNRVLKVAVIGAGDRGKDRYGAFIKAHSETIQVVAVAEPNAIKRAEMSETHQIPSESQFVSWDALLDQPAFCDGVLITTSDDLHFEPVISALEKGYHILLEKPMSNHLKEVVAIGKAAKEAKGDILVCHVLRYTPFYSTLKALIDSGAIGELVSIQHNENIGYYHFAHSFVRGNWRNTTESSPLILAKSCHDMDLLLWLAGSDCESLSSYGSLKHFAAANAPEGSGTRCLIDCDIHETCPFAAQKIYYPNIGKWPTSIASDIQTREGVEEALKTGPYERCVYHCDNDVVDHQVTALQFKNGVTATFNLSAFTSEVNRTLKIMGTKGEIRGNDLNNEIVLKVFGSESRVIIPETLEGGHGGGDTGIMNDFLKILRNEEALALTSAEKSVASHVMCFAAEHSRLTGETVKLQSFWESADPDQNRL